MPDYGQVKFFNSDLTQPFANCSHPNGTKTKTMKTFTCFIFIIQILLVAGCQNWDNYPEINMNGRLIRIEDKNHEVIGEYTYDKSGFLKESWSHSDYYMEDKNEEYTYTFDENYLLVKKDGFLPGNMVMSSIIGAMDKDVTSNYEYDSKDRISRITTNFVFDEMEEQNYETQLVFEYPEENVVISRLNTINELANSVSPETKYTLNKKGNIETVEMYYKTNEENRTIYLEEYTYDSHPAPVNVEPGVHSANNVLNKTMTSYYYDENGNQTVSYVSTYTYEYEYNSKGYPDKMTETWPNEIQNINYYYYY